MIIEIKVVAHARQRYATCGDWFYRPDGSKLVLNVSRMRDRRSEIAIILHELAEALLCEHDGISQEAVDLFDMGPIGSALDEPGDDPAAPYHQQHRAATRVERVMVESLGMTWDEHGAVVDALFGEKTHG